jgi:hypothetical protein
MYRNPHEPAAGRIVRQGWHRSSDKFRARSNRLGDGMDYGARLCVREWDGRTGRIIRHLGRKPGGVANNSLVFSQSDWLASSCGKFGVAKYSLDGVVGVDCCAHDFSQPEMRVARRLAARSPSLLVIAICAEKRAGIPAGKERFLEIVGARESSWLSGDGEGKKNVAEHRESVVPGRTLGPRESLGRGTPPAKSPPCPAPLSESARSRPWGAQKFCRRRFAPCRRCGPL